MSRFWLRDEFVLLFENVKKISDPYMSCYHVYSSVNMIESNLDSHKIKLDHTIELKFHQLNFFISFCRLNIWNQSLETIQMFYEL